MGWSNGSLIMCDIIGAVKGGGTRKDLYAKLIDVFANMDCDTLGECLGLDPEFDEAYEERFEEE